MSVDEIDQKCNDWFRKLNYCKKNPMLMKLKGPMQFCDYILRQVDVIKAFLPLLQLLKGRGMQQFHINMINKEFDMNIQMRETNFRWLTSQDLH